MGLKNIIYQDLINASRNGDLEVIKYLVEHGANVDDLEYLKHKNIKLKIIYKKPIINLKLRFISLNIKID